MGELERYGLLSLASILVLFLVLTFVGRDPEPRELIVRAAPLAVSADADPLLARAPVRVGGSAARVSPAASGERRSPPRARPVRSHVVRSGETLSGIAREYLGSSRRWPELVAANAPLDPRKLRVGKRLRIPATRRKSRNRAATGAQRSPADSSPARPPSARPPAAGRSLPVASARSHVIEKGDTLSSISNRYYGDYMQWKRIYRANRKQIPDARKLAVGTILDLP